MRLKFVLILLLLLLLPSVPSLVRFIFPAKVAITVVDFRLLWDFYDRSSVVGFQFGFCEGEGEGEKEGDSSQLRTTEEVFFLAPVAPSLSPSLSAI